MSDRVQNGNGNPLRVRRCLQAPVRFIGKLVLCWILKAHDWTSAAEQGIAPTPKQLADGVNGFWDYAKMYCKRCGHVSELSKQRMGGS